MSETDTSKTDSTTITLSSPSAREEFLGNNKEKREQNEQNDPLSIRNLLFTLGVLMLLSSIFYCYISRGNKGNNDSITNKDNTQASDYYQRGNSSAKIQVKNGINKEPHNIHAKEEVVFSPNQNNNQQERATHNSKPKIYPQKEQKIHKEVVRTYQYLTVYNRKLEIADEYQTIYYRMWNEDGKIIFDFVNNERTPMAINNRSFIIEPFCEIDESSKAPDESERIEIKKPGILNSDLSLNKKIIIKYI